MKLKSLTDKFLITNTPSIEEVEEFDRHVHDHQYSLQWRSWRVWQTRSWSPILPPLMKLKSLTDTFLITNTPSINEAEKFDRHVLDHQYSLHWLKSLTVSWSPILPPLKAEEFDRRHQFLDHQYYSSIEEAEEFDRHVLHHQYSLHWRSCKVWQTRSSSPILPPLKKLKSLTDTFLITNTPSINEAEEFDRHVLDHQYSLQ